MNWNIIFMFLIVMLSQEAAFTWAETKESTSPSSPHPLEVVDVFATENAIVVGLCNYDEKSRPDLVLQYCAPKNHISGA